MKGEVTINKEEVTRFASLLRVRELLGELDEAVTNGDVERVRSLLTDASAAVADTEVRRRTIAERAPSVRPRPRTDSD
jgi:hypothetical protein